MEIIKIIDESLINLRLDKALSILKEQFSRSKIQEYIDNELILVNGKIEKSSYKIKLNDEIIINDIPQTEYDLIPENIPLDIIYEDDDVLVINKQKGLVVHPGAGINSGLVVGFFAGERVVIRRVVFCLRLRLPRRIIQNCVFYFLRFFAARKSQQR